MDAEKMKTLAARADELVPIFLAESDPATWPAMNTRDGRGDRCWWKKNAMQTIALIQQILTMIRNNLAVVDPPPIDDVGDEAERLIEAAEKRAKEFLARHGKSPH